MNPAFIVENIEKIVFCILSVHRDVVCNLKHSHNVPIAHDTGSRDTGNHKESIAYFVIRHFTLDDRLANRLRSCDFMTV